MPSVKHEGFRQLKGDDSNHTLGIVVGESSRALHVCSADDVGTDWNVSSFTHPTAGTQPVSSGADASGDVEGSIAIRLGTVVKYLHYWPSAS